MFLHPKIYLANELIFTKVVFAQGKQSEKEKIEEASFEEGC